MGLLHNNFNKRASVTFYSVGQGDSILIETKNGKKVLIDGGPFNIIDYYIFRDFYNMIAPCYIDAVILTHSHKDHLFGLNRILERCEVGVVYYNGSEYDSGIKDYFDDLTNTKKKYIPSIGYSFVLDNWKFTFVSGFKSNSGDENNNSLGVVASMNEYDVLLLGDLDLANLPSKKIINESTLGEIELLLYPHHGSRYSLNKDFFNSFDFKNVVFSYGINMFGHPHDEVVTYFQDRNVPISSTYETGNLKFFPEF